MLTSRDIRVLHLEPTDVCQAACALCARETDADFDRHQHHHLALGRLQALLPPEFIKDLDKMFMCGNYGDPAAGRYTLDIYHYFRELNPTITLGMNTNGALQNTQWWTKLGELFQREQDYVVFSIDGLSDTNHLYRQGVDWNKMIKNIQNFISTGARAHWDMLVYKHNEHQVDACERLARDMGFAWFRAKISKRPLVGMLERPLSWSKPRDHTRIINCHALAEQSIYIDAQGRVSPCCWLGSRQSDFIEDFDQVRASWSSQRPNPVCVQSCGSQTDLSNFQAQWRKEIAL